MTRAIPLGGVTQAVAALDRAFQFGPSVERQGVITVTHAATWHVAGLIEQLHKLRADQAERLRCGELSAGPQPLKHGLSND
ncbi:hypothetical protein [Streptomyces flavofungini]|uniref:hypothetical protein n=1 Tax=Streptomyces flavofungini TaxID=68200 RepID=UPI0034DEB6E7